MKRSFLKYLAGGLMLFAVLGLYLLTLDNGLHPEELTGGDLITHQYAQVEARPSNAPGYPLYTMGGWLWFRLGRLALGWLLNPIQILSLYSTLWGLASLAILYLILLEVTRGQWLIPLVLTTFYATTFFFWYYSVTTEQYTSAIFQTLLIIWLAFQWEEQPRDSTLRWLAFTSGTMLANMVTTLFILPPLLWFILFRVHRADNGPGYLWFSYLKKPKLLLQLAGLALLPLLSYLFIYIRGAQHPEWRGAGEWASAWAWFVDFLTIQQGRDELAPGLTLQPIFTAEFPALIWQELTWPVFLGGLVGLAFLGRRRAIFLYSTLTIYFLFSWGYRFGNWFQVIIPAYPIFIIGVAAALQKATEWAYRFDKARQSSDAKKPFILPHSSLIPYLVALLLIGLPIYRLAASFPQANQRNRPDDTGLDPGWAILADGPIPPAVISGSFEEQVALEYLSTVWYALPEIYPTTAGHLSPPPNLAQQPHQIYISRRALAVAADSLQPQPQRLTAAGVQLIAVPKRPQTALPAGAQALGIEFGSKLELAGWEPIEPDDAVPEDIIARLPRANWQIALYWRAKKPLAADYTVSVRPLVGGQLITVKGEPLIQDHHPVWGAYPTSAWVPEELVRDVYALSLPSGLSPEAVQIIVYRAVEGGFENLAEHTVELKADGATVPR